MDKYTVPGEAPQATGPKDSEWAGTDADVTVDGEAQSEASPPAAPAPTPEAEASPTPPANNPFAKFNEEYASSGKLSEESYAELGKMGITKEYVDQYIAGVTASADRAAQEIYATVGGQDQYSKMIQWASEALSPAEIQAYNDAIEKSDAGSLKFAVQSLKARYEVAQGPKEPSLISGSKGAPSGYRSVAEVQKAMSDPRYRNDPAYRNDVIQRLAVSGNL